MQMQAAATVSVGMYFHKVSWLVSSNDYHLLAYRCHEENTAALTMSHKGISQLTCQRISAAYVDVTD
jgi:hypothetical protein